MVRKCAEQVAEVIGRNNERSPRSESEVKGQEPELVNEKEKLSETQQDLLDFVFKDVQTSVSELVSSVQAVSQQFCVSMETPKGKRLLPSQPRRSGSLEKPDNS